MSSISLSHPPTTVIASHIYPHPPVINDIAEMGVKLISDIINRSEDDWQKKFITQVPAIEWHVKEYPVYIKNVLNKCK